MKIDPNAEIKKFLRKLELDGLDEKTRLIRVVQAVAAIPWGEGRSIEEVLASKGVGTCTGKHLVLMAVLKELGVPHHAVVCTFRWGEQGVNFPDPLRHILEQGEWAHGHNFVHLQLPSGQWIDVDVTWNPELRKHGFASFPSEWDGQSSFLGVRHIVERFDNDDVKARKKQLIEGLSPDLKARRERFLSGFIEWIESVQTKSLAKQPPSSVSA